MVDLSRRIVIFHGYVSLAEGTQKDGTIENARKKHTKNIGLRMESGLSTKKLGLTKN